MSVPEGVLIRFFIALLVGGRTFLRFTGLIKPQKKEIYNRFDSTYFVFWLPFLLVFSFLLLFLIDYRSGDILLAMLVQLLLTLFVFTLLMLFLTPLLRKQISASGCAALWGLQSIAVYYCLMAVFSKRWSCVTMLPLFTVRLSANFTRIALGIWAAGFVAVLGWKIISHLRFRRNLLRDAEPFSEREFALFLETRDLLFVRGAFEQRQNKLQFYHSSAVETPLSIGLFRKTTCFLLPRRDYSDEELKMVFRHEIIHLLHDDNRLKFSLTLLCAAGWFLPSLWNGMEKASEELELSCDELATGVMQEAERRQYAGLLLNTAGPAKGFTTCLSASASGLKYRLTRVLHPQRLAGGRLAAFLLTVMIVFFFGSVGFSIKAGTLGSEILSANGGAWKVTGIVTDLGYYPCKDQEAVKSYLEDLTITKPLWEMDRNVIGGAVIVKLYRDDGQKSDLRFTGDGTYLYVSDPEHSAANILYKIEGTANLDWLRSMAMKSD